MTAPNLIAIVGAGSALTLAGFALMGGAAGAALAYYFPQIHLSIWLLIIGGIMLVLGLALVERGGTKTVEKVETELTMPNVVANFPWTFIGLGAAGGMLIFWLVRKIASTNESPRTEIKPIVVPTPAPMQARNSFASPPPEKPKRMTLTDVLVPLGSAAASYATSVGMKALGIPTPKEMLGSLIQKFTGSQESNGSPDRQSSDSRRHAGYESAMRRS
jgi:hypothetical protein